jgi:hypothetical protein
MLLLRLVEVTHRMYIVSMFDRRNIQWVGGVVDVGGIVGRGKPISSATHCGRIIGHAASISNKINNATSSNNYCQNLYSICPRLRGVCAQIPWRICGIFAEKLCKISSRIRG